MKRMIYILLAASLCLCGCTDAAPAQTTIETTTTPTTATTPATIIPVKQAPMYAISLPVITEFTNAEDGVSVFSHVYQNISLTLPESEVADKIILDFLNRTDTTQTANELSEAAKAAYAQGTGEFMLYMCSTTYEPVRLDSSVLSLVGTVSVFSGGTHPENISTAVTYDLLTGLPLSSSAVLQETVSVDELISLITEALAPQADHLYEDYISLVSDKFSGGIDQNPDWYFSTDGLCFFFSPYEIGPFASGTCVATIPYGKLTGILRDAYFPAERDIASGNIQMTPYAEADLSSFTQFTEITTSPGSEKVLLHTDGMVHDIRITQKTVVHPYTSFVPSFTVFAAYTLTPGDAIVLETDRSATVTYTSGSEQLTETFDP